MSADVARQLAEMLLEAVDFWEGMCFRDCGEMDASWAVRAEEMRALANAVLSETNEIVEEEKET